MKIGNLLILIIVAAVLGVGAVYLYQNQNNTMTTDQPAEGLARGEKLFSNLADKVAQIAKVQFTKTSDTITLVRADGNDWVISSRGDYPADSANLNKLVIDLTDLKVGDRLTKKEDRYAGFGLGAAVGSHGSLVILDKEDKEITSLMLGKERASESGSLSGAGGGGGRYVRVNQDPFVYLVQEQLYWVGTKITDWAKSEIMSVPANEIVALTIERPSTETLSVSWDGATPMIAGLNPDQAPKISELVSARGALNGLTMTDVITSESASSRTLEKLATYKANNKNGTVYLVNVFSGDDDYFITVSASSDKPVFTTEDKSSTETLKAAEEMADKAKGEVDGFNKRHSPWYYQISSWNKDKFATYRKDVIEKATDPEDEADPSLGSDEEEMSDAAEALGTVEPLLSEDVMTEAKVTMVTPSPNDELTRNEDEATTTEIKTVASPTEEKDQEIKEPVETEDSSTTGATSTTTDTASR